MHAMNCTKISTYECVTIARWTWLNVFVNAFFELVLLIGFAVQIYEVEPSESSVKRATLCAKQKAPSCLSSDCLFQIEYISDKYILAFEMY